MSDAIPASPAPSAEPQSASDAPESPQTSQPQQDKGKGGKVSYNRSFNALEITPDLPTEAERPDKPQTSEERQRDAFGRFISGEPAERVAKVEEIPAAEQDEPSEFLFGGRKWKSTKEAEQNFKSLQGQFKPLAERAAASEAHEAKAAGWYREAQRLQARLAELEGQPAKSKTQDASQADKGLDWELYAEIRNAAEVAGKPYEAERWLLEQYDKQQSVARQAELEQLKTQLQEGLAPILTRHQAAQAAEHVEMARQSVLAQAVDAQGRTLLPELNDGNALEEAGRLWNAAGLPRESAMTPAGMVAAVLLHRFLKSQGSPAQDIDETTTETETDGGTSPASMARSAMVTSESPRTRSTTPVPPEVARLISSMRKSGAEKSYYIQD